MSTQRRVARVQRFLSTELTRTEIPSSSDVGGTGQENRFRRVGIGLTALATNSLSSSSRCKWSIDHGYSELCGAGSSYIRMSCSTDSSPVQDGTVSGSDSGSMTGFLPEQLPLNSPFLVRVSPLHSALPQVPMSVGSGTERQHGQGNLYLQHAARNAACDIGR